MKNFLIYRTLIFIAMYCTYLPLSGQPSTKNKLALQEVNFYPDVQVPNVFYYTPRDLQLVMDAEGKPDVHLLLMRYQGTRLDGKQGQSFYRNLLSLQVVQVKPGMQELKRWREELAVLTGNPNVLIKPLPIQNLQAIVIFAPADGAFHPAGQQQDTTAMVFDNGYFEFAESERGEVWQERKFVLPLNEQDAQLLWEGLQSRKTILSLGYFFSAKLNQKYHESIILEGSPEMVAALENKVATQMQYHEQDSIQLYPVCSGAFEVELDTEKWPDLLKKVDINEKLPPGYAFLETYCYDFTHDLRQDLIAKRLEIKAAGVGGKEVKQRLTFSKSAPEKFASGIFFPYAVRIDLPYHYRIVEIAKDGRVSKTDWIEGDDWHSTLDITSTALSGDPQIIEP